jgi:putative ATP-dependent endonuclease of the OLD family
LDRDERDDAEVELLKTRLGAKAQVVVLEKREIDNFLLSSHAIERFIRLKQRMSGKKPPLEPDLQLVEKALNECADSLRQRTIDKRIARILCGPVRPKLDWTQVPETPIGDRVMEVLAGMQQQVETTQNQIASVIEQQTQAVSQIWEERKFDIVQGDILLDLVCQKCGARYKKSSDAGRLAALMEKHQIDLQLKQTIEAIAVVV